MLKPVALALLFACSPVLAAEHLVSSADEIAKLSLQPGDAVVLKDGAWKDQKITLSASGTEQAPLTLRPQTPGGVTLSGKSSVTLAGDYITCSGLFLKDTATGGGDGFALRGNHNRLTDCAVTGGSYKFLVHLIGQHERVDHCYMAGKTNEDPTFQIEVDKDKPNYDQVDHNHFGHRPELGKNGGETMRVGYSGQSQWNSRATVEHNLYDRCDGEIEIISSKSCENVYRYNTFSECGGFLTLRHGHRCTVDSNVFLANHKKGSGGVRVINEDHVITNNYISGVDKGAFWITSGIQNGPLTGYTRAKDVLIANNTVVDFAGPGVELAAGLGTSNRTLLPENVTLANNLFSPGKNGTLIKGDKGTYHWINNLATSGDGGTMISATTVALVPDPQGLLRPTTDIPAATIPPTTPHLDKFTPLATAGIAKTPPQILTPKDVGPSWLPAERRND